MSGRCRVIAGHHDHIDPRVPTGTDCLSHAVACRVLEAENTKQHEFAIRLVAFACPLLSSNCERAQTLPCQRLHLVEPGISRWLRERLNTVTVPDPGAFGEYKLGRAFYAHKNTAIAAVQSRHKLCFWVERLFAQLGHFCYEIVTPQSAARRDEEQREFRRVADARGAALLQHGVIAKHGCLEQLIERGVVSIGRVAARDLESCLSGQGCMLGENFGIGQQDRGDDHPIFSQRTRLVGQYRTRCPKRFDRRQFCNQSVSASHPPHAPCQGNRRHDRQALRDGRNRERNRDLDGEKNFATESDADKGDEDRDGKNQPDEVRA